MSVSHFGSLPDGTVVERFQFDDGTLRVAILTLGGVIAEVLVPDRSGVRADVVLGFDDLASYRRPQPYHGAIIGRFANRIAGARFELNGRTYQLRANEGPHHLHGGPAGFGTRVWTGEELTDGPGVRLRLTSADGDEGYPARLDVVVEYRLGDGTLTIDYAATNAEPAGGPSTIVNLTNHSYLNLAGQAAVTVADHVVQVPADRYLRCGPGSIPTGEIAPVDGTPLDLRAGRPFGAGWDDDLDQIRQVGGYDHTFVLDGVAPGRLRPAARVVDPASGRVLEVFTDQPGCHLYSGNQLTPDFGGKRGHAYRRREGFCVETQHFPDSPHHPHFPSTVLAPQETFRTTTAFRFSTAP